jgi:hypothetical protein
MNRAPLLRLVRVAVLVAIVASLLAVRPAYAVDPLGFPICDVSGDQMLPVVVPDGTNGVIIAWLDRRPGVAAAGVCFAQRLNAQGNPQWTFNGVQLSTTGDVNPPVIAPDGAGGAYVAFGGDTSPARVQWVNAAGVVQWGADGTALSSGSGSQRDLAIARDDNGAGGAIVAWREGNGIGGTADIHAQKVSSAGAIQWSPLGQAVVATNMNSEALPALVSDNAGGAFVMWLGNGARAQRLDAAGTPLWGNTVLSATANNRVPAIALDGAGGVITAWGGGGIFAQRVSSTGSRLWNPTNTGVQLSTLGNQVTLIPDGAGGGIFAWQENRSGTNFNVYAQKLNSAGALQWLSTGAEVCVETQDQLAPAIVPDGGTGAIITWYDLRSGATVADVYAQRIDASSAPQWTPDGGPGLCRAAPPGVPGDRAGRRRRRVHRVGGPAVQRPRRHLCRPSRLRRCAPRRAARRRRTFDLTGVAASVHGPGLVHAAAAGRHAAGARRLRRQRAQGALVREPRAFRRTAILHLGRPRGRRRSRRRRHLLPARGGGGGFRHPVRRSDAVNERRAQPARGRGRSFYALGRMFWLWWKTLSGSYAVFTSTSRSWTRSPYASRTRSGVSSPPRKLT